MKLAGWLGLAVTLGACAPSGVRPTESTQRADSADQVMTKMITRLTSGGVLRSFVEADTSYLYQSTQTMDLRGLKIRFLDQQGNLQSTLTARRGIFNSYSEKLDARGDVVVESTDRQILRTQHLVYDKTSNQISSDSAFTYDGKTDHLSGNGFRSDTDFKNITIDQPKGVIRGKGVLLPGK